MKLLIIKLLIGLMTIIAGVGTLHIRKKLEEENVSAGLKDKILFILLSLLSLSAIAQLVSVFIK